MYDLDQQPFELTSPELPCRQKLKRESAVDDDERDRDFLSACEIEVILTAALRGRFGLRDHGIPLLVYRHGLRASELMGLMQTDPSLRRTITGEMEDYNALKMQVL